MKEFEVASEAMQKLMECVETAIDYENSEIALICAVPLAKMLDIERGNYFSDERPNYNHAVAIVKSAFNFIKKEGLPSWMHNDFNKLKEFVKELG